MSATPPTTTAGTAATPMGLWRLEWLRLARTRRLAALVGVFAFFGLTAAPLARWTGELANRFGGSVQILTPPPVPVDALTSYVSNASQLGLLVFVLVTAGAVTVDARPESAVFLRTRVRHPRDLVVPRLVANAAAGTGAYVTGALLAWYGAVALLGDLPAGPTAAAIALSALYLPLLAAVAALVATRSASVAVTALSTLAVALLSGVGGTVLPDGLARWLPSHLVGSLTAAARGGDVTEALPAAATTMLATAILTALAVRLAGRREL